MGLRAKQGKRRYRGGAKSIEGPLMLCVDTAGDWMNVSLQKGKTLLAVHSSFQRHSHARGLLPTIETMLANHDLSLDEVDAYGACLGPGSFTGLRVGIATVKSFCWARNKLAVGVSATSLLAAAAPDDGLIGCAIDAKKGEVYFGLYRRTAGELHTVVEPFVAKPAEGLLRLQEAAPGELTLLGSACQAYERELKEAASGDVTFAPRGLGVPSAALLAHLCMAELTAGRTVEGDSLEPAYVRPPSITKAKTSPSS